VRRLLPILACAASIAAAHARDLPPSVRAALERAKVPLSAVSLLVEPVDKGSPVLVHQIALPMNPASVMKLVTTYAALDTLGPAFTFHTDVLHTGEIANGVLAGDLVLRGGGDPELTYERVWQLAHRLRSRGIREIRGDVIVDRGYFAPAVHDPAGFDNQPMRAYNVGADALLVNFQAIDFRFVATAGGVRVVPEPDLPNVEIVSRVKTSPGACDSWRKDLRYEGQSRGLIATVFFEGSFPASCGERALPLVVLGSAAYTESVWRWVWNEAGGVLRGKVRAAATPSDAVLFYRQESEPLAALVRDTNKFSNNVMARHMFLALSAERTGQGTPEESARIVAAWLHERGIVAPELVLENGSGLSRNERVSAATLAAVLRAAWASPTMSELVSSLPVLSVDGTLKSRRASAAGGHAHLKGGTLDGVQAMAGYVLDRNGRRWIVVMIVNHDNANAAQPALDALAEWTWREAGSGR
jgi:D-alanyl-D-alanine carboxypeptidase/D-alanyl-D-alanine-endopeptidase (penicillin-binding protein 4)